MSEKTNEKERMKINQTGNKDLKRSNNDSEKEQKDIE